MKLTLTTNDDDNCDDDNNSYVLANHVARLIIGIFAKANLITCISCHIVVYKCLMCVHLGKKLSIIIQVHIYQEALYFTIYLEIPK